MGSADAVPKRRRRSHPRFKREGEPPPIAVTDDDVAILRHVFRHRFVRAEDLFRLLPERSRDRLSRRLMLLYRAGYLDRPRSQIDRFGEGGSQSLVYGLDNAGARVVREKCGISTGRAEWHTRNRSYTRDNLDHTLAVSRYMIDVEVACRNTPGLSLIPFEEILANAPEATRRSKYPMRWPVSISYGGARGVVHLQPDAIFGIRQKTETGTRSAYFFLEVDRGTMTIVPSEKVIQSEAFVYRATVLRKLASYSASYRAGLHTRLFGFTFPRTIFVSSSASRTKTVRSAVSELIEAKRFAPSGLIVVGATSGRAVLDFVISSGGGDFTGNWRGRDESR